MKEWNMSGDDLPIGSFLPPELQDISINELPKPEDTLENAATIYRVLLEAATISRHIESQECAILCEQSATQLLENLPTILEEQAQDREEVLPEGYITENIIKIVQTAQPTEEPFDVTKLDTYHVLRAASQVYSMLQFISEVNSIRIGDSNSERTALLASVSLINNLPTVVTAHATQRGEIPDKSLIKDLGFLYIDGVEQYKNNSLRHALESHPITPSKPNDLQTTIQGHFPQARRNPTN